MSYIICRTSNIRYHKHTSYVICHISYQYIYMHVYTLHLAREPKLLSPEERTALAVMMRATVSKKGRVRTTSRSTSRVPMTCQTSLALTWQKKIQWPNLHFKQNFREWGIPTYTYIVAKWLPDDPKWHLAFLRHPGSFSTSASSAASTWACACAMRLASSCQSFQMASHFWWFP